MRSARASDRSFVLALALAFVASAALTIAWCGSMSRMHAMPMPGGWSMSMMWMRMPGQTWPGLAASFLGMWVAMMTAMMLPSLLPMLRRYRAAVAAAGIARADRPTAVACAAYFAVWTLFGLAAFVAGAAIAALEMALPALARTAPLASGAIVTIAGAAQLTRWKARQLACCRRADACGAAVRGDLAGAWRHGLMLGVRCVRCCLGLTIALLVVGAMDLGAMAFATAAISAERLAPRGERIARISGVVLLAAGLGMLGRAV